MQVFITAGKPSLPRSQINRPPEKIKLVLGKIMLLAFYIGGHQSILIHGAFCGWVVLSKSFSSLSQSLDFCVSSFFFLPWGSLVMKMGDLNPAPVTRAKTSSTGLVSQVPLLGEPSRQPEFQKLAGPGPKQLLMASVTSEETILR